MDIADLKSLLGGMPDYTAQTPLADVRAWLRGSDTVPDHTPVTMTVLMARLSLDEATTVIATLKSIAASNAPAAPLVAEAIEQLRGAGIDLSHANARTMCDALFAEPLRSAVKALGERSVRRLESIPGWTDDDASLDHYIGEARK